MLQTLVNRSLTEPVPSIPEGFEMTVCLVFGQTLFKWIPRLMFLRGGIVLSLRVPWNSSLHGGKGGTERARVTVQDYSR
jgi:hypothetical protein